ncbi:chemotaxis protein CheA [Sulfuricurvum sp.]|uniref:chemotaxis protein CheA n=1 Tax=Sulfuricurvum sp. TaxID=2025608 RepID=UPI002E3747F0|nr:chemotaxis protein CheA [Sulfuricurvum sp.]HEX5330944.1 chemotaxis protein CheA [Sulfuricurvum sp.]
MTREELRAVFIEEAYEIIEQLDINIINYEENPSDKEILNGLFRGVHTLKGSANSFGFTALGSFVHHFEDLLDRYRDLETSAPSNVVDLFFKSVDVIKETMQIDMSGGEELPQSYHQTLDAIKQQLDGGNTPPENDTEALFDLSSEFSDFTPHERSTLSQSIQDRAIQEGKKIYRIVLRFDPDIYHRGYDHGRFFHLLKEKGEIIESTWSLRDIPDSVGFNPEYNYWNSVEVIMLSSESLESLSEVFMFVEPKEYEICPIENESIPRKVEKIASESENQNASESKSVPHNGKEEKRSFVKIDTLKLDELFDSVGEMVIAQNFLAENEEILRLASPTLNRTLDNLNKITRLIQKRVMALRMVPVHDTFEKMKRVVRDASKKVGKEIEFIIEGEETEVDKTMVDLLSDPLIHIMRNAIDHGIEHTLQERLDAGKSAKGRVSLRAFHKGGNIAIEVRDDGAGIDRDKVLTKAIERGLVSAGEDLSDQQIYALIMQAGFSTADTISDISGRGVGLDVVRSSIEKLQGKIEIDSKKGEGSVFTIWLPLTLAIIDGMLVKSGENTFIVPTLSVIESFTPSPEIVHTIKGEGEFVDLRGEMIPVLRLNRVLGINNEMPLISESILMCLESDEGKYALLIDGLVGRQQVVIKSLGKALAGLRGISGGAIMGNGDIALILGIDDLPDLMPMEKE